MMTDFIINIVFSPKIPQNIDIYSVDMNDIKNDDYTIEGLNADFIRIRLKDKNSRIIFYSTGIINFIGKVSCEKLNPDVLFNIFSQACNIQKFLKIERTKNFCIFVKTINRRNTMESNEKVVSEFSKKIFESPEVDFFQREDSANYLSAYIKNPA